VLIVGTRQHITTFLIDSKIVTRTAWGKAYKYTVHVGTHDTAHSRRRTNGAVPGSGVPRPPACSENRGKPVEREEVAQVLEVVVLLHRRRGPAGRVVRRGGLGDGDGGGVPRRLRRRRLGVEEPRVGLEVPEAAGGVDGRVLERHELAQLLLLEDGQAAALGGRRVGVVLGEGGQGGDLAEHGRRRRLRAGLVARCRCRRRVLPGPGPGAAVSGGGRGEVGGGVGPAELDGGGVVDARGLLRGVEGAEPDAHAAPRVADLRRELAPRPPPHAAELGARRATGALGHPSPHTAAHAGTSDAALPPAVAVPGVALIRHGKSRRCWCQLPHHSADPPGSAALLVAGGIGQVRIVPEDPHRARARHGTKYSKDGGRELR
jgi:hypothetical protein